MVEIFESPVEDLHVQFSNLKYVKLQTCVTRECVLAIIHLLNASPQIEIVSLQNIENVTSWEQLHEDERMRTSANMVEWSDLALSNQCMIHHRLKVLEIHSFIGCLNELKLLQMMLKNAAALEEMLIWTMKDEMTSGRKEHLINFKKMLLKTPRASSNVAISFFIESLKA
ncbi:hypothetical protein Sjap_003601 [Stephania japonica]|uniref:FBD domain-containing protein n=1 Tax=Stephania japonica TaxID=461633 RepID=A0AAP0KP84_9MAGN